MEPSCSRFTAPEGGTRLANVACYSNTLVVEHTAFVATRLLYEDAYKVRGSLLEGKQRSVYITRASRVQYVAYELRILTDLSVSTAVQYEDVLDWVAEIEMKQVLVCTAPVIKQILEEAVLTMTSINVLVIDSCHLIEKDKSLQYIMRIYKATEEGKRPRILAMTYPLFPANKKSANGASNETDSNENNDTSDKGNVEESKVIENDKDMVEEIEPKLIKALIIDSKIEKDPIVSDEASNNLESKSVAITEDSKDTVIESTLDTTSNSVTEDEVTETVTKDTVTETKFDETADELTTEMAVENNVLAATKVKVVTIGAYDNQDDFEMYEKLEWKLDVLEQELCCKVDLAEDTDSAKRVPPSSLKPRECIVEYDARSAAADCPPYAELAEYMRAAILDALKFVDDHRYDPTEIYGEDLYEELKCIPDPTIEPRQIFAQFLYILDQLGPYGADKAAFSLLAKLEKLKIKVPYERHFLLLCLCTTVFVRVRCRADAAFAPHESEWDRIRRFSTPKVLRLVEILERFKPPPAEAPAPFEDKKSPFEDKKFDGAKLCRAIEQCDFKSLGDRIEDRVNTYVGNLSEIHVDCPDEGVSRPDIASCEAEAEAREPDGDTVKSEGDPGNPDIDAGKPDIDPGKPQPTPVEPEVAETTDTPPQEVKPLAGFHRRGGHRNRNRRAPRTNPGRSQLMSQNPDALCGIIFMQEALMAKILFNVVVELSRHHPALGFICAQYTGSDDGGAAGGGCARELEVQRRRQEEVLKKFRMHECNLILATPSLEEGIDLPRCNLVLRWDEPASYRSYACGRARCRAARACCCVLAPAAAAPRLAAYTALDQIVSKKCGCGVQDEPTQDEEDYADIFTRLVTPYSPKNELDNKYRSDGNTSDITDGHARSDIKSASRTDGNISDITDGNARSDIKSASRTDGNISDITDGHARSDIKSASRTDGNISDITDGNARSDIKSASRTDGNISDITDGHARSDIKSASRTDGNISDITDGNARSDIESASDENKSDSIDENNVDRIDKVDSFDENKLGDVCDSCGKANVGVNRCCCLVAVSREDGDNVSVDLSTAISLINKYCAKLPSDTFTRLAAACWTERLRLRTSGAARAGGGAGEADGGAGGADGGAGVAEEEAYVCTIRLPLNSPVNCNIVGHPMRTRTLARRAAALQAARALHRAAELDDRLQPVGKDNFKSTESDASPTDPRDPGDPGDLGDLDPGDLARPGTTKRRQYYYKRTARAFTNCQPVVNCTDEEVRGPMPSIAEDIPERDRDKHNVLYALNCTLWCSLPERYNTRGRVLHAPQHAAQALAILMRGGGDGLRLPPFPVYTRSGEVRVTVRAARAADTRLSPRRARVVRRFMRFVFADVLRVRRKGMKLQTEGSTHNNYYIVPTIKSQLDDGSTKIDIDWDFLDVIYRHTEEKKYSELEKPVFWQDDDDNSERTQSPKDSPTFDSFRCTCPESDGHRKDNANETKSQDVITVTNVSTYNANVTNSNKIKEHTNTAKSDTDTGEAIIDKNSESEPIQDNAKAETSRTEGEIKIPDYIQTDLIEHLTRNPSALEDFKRMMAKKPVKVIRNPLLKPGEVFVFDPDKYREAVVTPWYRNRDQPQFFLVAEICAGLTAAASFPSAQHATFRTYYWCKYRAPLTAPAQPLLDVDHTSARLNLLTPRYVNRKGVALPVSSERTRRAKRSRLDQKQILVPELCMVHPFAAPLWFATVALPCVLYRINALLIADEIRRAVALDAGLGAPELPGGFAWPPLDFGWSLCEVLNADEKNEKKKEDVKDGEKTSEEIAAEETQSTEEDKEEKESAADDASQEQDDAGSSGFEIGTWSNDMAASLPPAAAAAPDAHCASACGGADWRERRAPRHYTMADSDCSYESSDFDTDDSEFDSSDGEDGFSERNSDAMGVRIEYKTAHEAEAVDVLRKKRTELGPQPDERDDDIDRGEQEEFLRSGDTPKEYKDRYNTTVERHESDIRANRLIAAAEPVGELLPEMPHPTEKKPTKTTENLLNELFPYCTEDGERLIKNAPVDLKTIEKSKRLLLEDYKKKCAPEEIKKLNCFSMVDIDIDAPNYVNEKRAGVGFDTKEKYEKLLHSPEVLNENATYCLDDKSGNEFDFDYQPDLRGHPGPSPSIILQALTMSNANDGINLERLETIGDSYLKLSVTCQLYCANPAVHEGKLSHARSKQVSNLNLYRLGRARRLGGRMVASKFEPHDNWLPPCHAAPATPAAPNGKEAEKNANNTLGDGCYIPYNLITQHSIPDKSIADCVEALIGAYLLECGPRGALIFMCWLGLRVLPVHEVTLADDHPWVARLEEARVNFKPPEREQPPPSAAAYDTDSDSECAMEPPPACEEEAARAAAGAAGARGGGGLVGSLAPRRRGGKWVVPVFGELRPPPSPLLRHIADPHGELERMLSGYDALEATLHYKFRDRALLLQALTHASHRHNRVTDCYQRAELLGDAVLDYLITRHLYEDGRRHSPGALTDLRSALVNNTIFATLAVRHGFHKYFRHMSPGLNEVLTKYVKIQEENGHSISEEHYLIHEDEMEQAEDVEVPKALGDLFESIAGAIYLDSGMSLSAVWRSYGRLMGAELEAFSAAAPKSPVRELLEAEPDTAKFGKPERLADGRRVRVCVEVFGRGVFKGVGRNYRIAKGTAARCALRHLRKTRGH